VKRADYRKQVAYEQLQNKTLDFAFFGTSHTNSGANPAFIPNSYNYGGGGKGYPSIYDYLSEMITNNKSLKIKNLVLEIDLATFSYGATDNIFDYNTKTNYLSECLSFQIFAKATHLDYFRRLIKRCFPLIGHGEDFSHLTSNPTSQIFVNGFQPYVGNLALENATRDGLAHYKGVFEGKNIISDAHFDYFIKILRLAKDNNIKVILIRFPMPKEYDEAHKQFNFSEDYYFDSIFKKVGLILGDNYIVLDYYNLFFNETDYFGDITHLNNRGGEKLSKKIYQDLRILNLTA